MRMEVDHVLRIIGEFGPYQKRLYIILSFAIIPASFQLLMNVFIARHTVWSCSDVNTTEICPVSRSCGTIRHISSYTSIVSEWNLICEDTYKVEFSQSIFMLGALLGGLGLGMFADIYGRRSSWFLSYTVMVGGGVGTALSTSLNVLFVSRLVAGIGTGGVLLCGFVLVTELIGPSYRGVTGTLSSCFFTFGQMLLPIFAYLLPDWRELCLILSLVGVIFMLFIRSIPESPRWLMIVGRASEAERILTEAALNNGLALPKTLLQIGRPMEHSRRYRGCLELCGNCCIAKKTIVVAMIWFINSFVYYGLTFNMKNIYGNIFFNFFLTSAIELPAYFLSFCIINWIGRRRSAFYCMAFSGMACLTCLFIQAGETSTYMFLSTVSAVLGKFGIAASFSIMHLFSAELFPTVVRNIGMGICSMAGRIGAVFSPMIVFLGNYTHTFPIMIFGLGAFAAAFLTLLLEDTLNRPLSETLQDDLPSEEFGKYVCSYQQATADSDAFCDGDLEENVFALIDSDVENDFPATLDNKRTFI